MDKEPTTSIERDGDVAVYRLLGEHDLASAPAVRAELKELIRGGEPIVVDASETAFVDSTIIRVLLLAEEEMRQRQRPLVLQLVAGGAVERTLALAGVVPAIANAPSRREALALARASASATGAGES